MTRSWILRPSPAAFVAGAMLVHCSSSSSPHPRQQTLVLSMGEERRFDQRDDVKIGYGFLQLDERRG